MAITRRTLLRGVAGLATALLISPLERLVHASEAQPLPGIEKAFAVQPFATEAEYWPLIEFQRYIQKELVLPEPKYSKNEIKRKKQEDRKSTRLNSSHSS